MDIKLIGQVGNWLFHTAAAVKEFGRDKLTGAVACVDRERYARSNFVFKSLCDWLPVRRGTRDDCSEEAVRRAGKSNWQSLSCIPSRDECRKLFNVVRRTDVTYPVVHVRGSDYFTYFKGLNVVMGAGHIRRCIDALGFKPEDCVVVTDDSQYVESLGLNPRGVLCGTAVEAFSVMANASHLVMSPSTFSWWAGFLGYHDRVIMPLGVGPWDAGVMRNDPISAQSNEELCWGDECVPVDCTGSGEVALVTVCTGRYVELFKGFYESFRKHADHGAVLYVMTDNPDRVKADSNYTAVPIPISHKPWPGVVLGKYGYFTDAGHMLRRHRAIMSVQVNSRFVKDVDFTSLIRDRILFCHHPYNSPGSKYICGGVVGGPSGEFLDMASWVSTYLLDELAAGRMPKWYDETALNEYKNSCAPPCDALPREFTYAEERSDMKTADAVIMFKDKDKFFGCKKSEYAS